MSPKRFRLAMPSLIAAVAAAAALLAPGEAAADLPYGCACLHNNKLSTPVNYRFKWGTGDWKNVKLAPGHSEWMCWTYKDAPKSPDLVFQLDVDLTSGSKFETFAIKRVQSKEKSCSAIPSAGHYHVGVTKGNSKKIQIYGGKT